MRIRAMLVGGAIALCSLLGMPAASPAVDFKVNSRLDRADSNVNDGVCKASNGRCTLRAAVQSANAVPGGDRILVPGGVYRLTHSGGDLNLTDATTIDGAGARKTIIDAQGMSRHFAVEQAILSYIQDVGLINGRANLGGAIYATSGLQVNRTHFRSNRTSTGSGGAIASLASLYVTNSSFAYNRAGGSGGAGGGAIFSGNTNELVIDSSSFYFNQAQKGGALLAVNSRPAITNSTLSRNRGPQLGAAIAVSYKEATIRNTIVDFAGPFDLSANCGTESNGKITSKGFNLETVAPSCGFTQSTDIKILGSARLEDYGAHGGPADTMPPQADSPAVDKGDNAGTCPARDQRGYSRPFGQRCEIGAVERGLDLSSPVFLALVEAWRKASGGNTKARCTRTNFSIDVNASDESSLRSFRVFLNGRLISSGVSKRRKLTIGARVLASGRHNVRFVAVDKNGRGTTQTASFRRC